MDTQETPTVSSHHGTVHLSELMNHKSTSDLRADPSVDSERTDRLKRFETSIQTLFEQIVPGLSPKVHLRAQVDMIDNLDLSTSVRC